jgi:hypothetical protein
MKRPLSSNPLSRTPRVRARSKRPAFRPALERLEETATMALAPGSSALDAGSGAVPVPTDQRGFNRPVGAAPDLGAFEYQPPWTLPSP